MWSNAGVTTIVSCEIVVEEKQQPRPRPAAASHSDWFLRMVRIVIAAALASALYQIENFFCLALLAALVLLDVREWLAKPTVIAAHDDTIGADSWTPHQ